LLITSYLIDSFLGLWLFLLINIVLYDQVFQTKEIQVTVAVDCQQFFPKVKTTAPIVYAELKNYIFSE